MQREYYIGVPIGVGVLIIIYIFGKYLPKKIPLLSVMNTKYEK